ncbi:MAG: PadR family transcriptional regulator [Ardenticatenaceae bacterium]|nr:PadR family transcriptional regulator [Anaerolineales bacterium]MCB8921792.1 PadR family transcriptional regulator [Ardenticatenaceae bacterium]
MSLKHAILGFLSFAPEPLTGYDLKKAFDNSVRHFWPANQSQIYRTLAALAEDGLVEIDVVERAERLDMKLYHITENGRAELHHWLSTPLPPQDYREASLIQVFFGGNLTDDELLNVLQHEAQAIEERLALYAEIYTASLDRIDQANNPRALALSVFTLEYGITSDQSALNWLRSVIERLQTGNYSPANLAILIGDNHENNV